MAVRLHRCPITFLKTEGHGCWQVQKALQEAGIEHEVVKAPFMRPRREDVIRLTGQQKVPVIEFEDGTALREEGKALAERIRSGRLFEGRDSQPGGDAGAEGDPLSA